MENPHIKAGLRIKHRIALTAFACALPAIPFIGHLSLATWVIGLLISFVWANLFEYVYHRWPLHDHNSRLYKRHVGHHTTVGTPEEPENTTFAGNSWSILALFGLNIIPFLFFKMWPVVLIGFMLYFLALEEAHWRIHTDGWVPFGKEHHFRHHDIPTKQFNVYIPLFDWIFGTL